MSKYRITSNGRKFRVEKATVQRQRKLPPTSWLNAVLGVEKPRYRNITSGWEEEEGAFVTCNVDGWPVYKILDFDTKEDAQAYIDTKTNQQLDVSGTWRPV